MKIAESIKKHRAEIISGVAGVSVLAGAAFFVSKPKPKTSDSSDRGSSHVSEQQSAELTEVESEALASEGLTPNKFPSTKSLTGSDKVLPKTTLEDTQNVEKPGPIAQKNADLKQQQVDIEKQRQELEAQKRELAQQQATIEAQKAKERAAAQERLLAQQRAQQQAAIQAQKAKEKAAAEQRAREQALAKQRAEEARKAAEAEQERKKSLDIKKLDRRELDSRKIEPSRGLDRPKGLR